MTEFSDPKPELEIKSDADWKQRVKAEAAQLDAERTREVDANKDGSSDEATGTPQADDAVGAQVSSESSPPEIDAAQLPPADFPMLVSMFSTQALVALGVVPNPASGKAERNLGLARHFIDLLGILDEKTRGNLTDVESTLLEQSLHELRMAFVELSRPGKETQ